MQRDAKGRFASTEQKRNATTHTAGEMRVVLRDLAHLQAAEDHLQAMEVSELWSILRYAFMNERRDYLQPFLQTPDSILFQ